MCFVTRLSAVDAILGFGQDTEDCSPYNKASDYARR